MISSPHAADRLSAARLRRALGDDVLIGREIIVRRQVTSSNDCIFELARKGAPEGLVLFAEYQTAGRGQRDNIWESAAGKGLWFSLLLRPKPALNEALRLAQWCASTVALTIQDELNLAAAVKLPNDVYIADRKVAGVLVEMRAQPRASHLAIVGVGLNVNQRPENFSEELRGRATSLASVQQRQLDRHSLAVALLRNLNLRYAELFG